MRLEARRTTIEAEVGLGGHPGQRRAVLELLDKIYAFSYDKFRIGKMVCQVERVIAGFQCAGCGEWNETTVDESAGYSQSYVEDCQVCCKPNLLRISFDPETEQCMISAELE